VEWLGKGGEGGEGGEGVSVGDLNGNTHFFVNCSKAIAFDKV
jgi:hypothetical protein